VKKRFKKSDCFTNSLVGNSKNQFRKMFKLFLISLLFINSCFAANPWEPEAGSGGWLQRHQQLTQYTQQHKNQVKALFIGASITDYWQAEGKSLWESYYLPKGSANYGIGGDSTSNVLWRIQNKELDGLNPKVLVIGSGPGN